MTELPGYQSERRKLFESQDSVNTSSPGEVNLSLAMNAEVLLGAFIQAPPLKTSSDSHRGPLTFNKRGG